MRRCRGNPSVRRRKFSQALTSPTAVCFMGSEGRSIFKRAYTHQKANVVQDFLSACASSILRLAAEIDQMRSLSNSARL